MKFRVSFVLSAALLAGAGFAQQPAAAPKPPTVPKVEVVKPKAPYDDRDGKLAAMTEQKLRLQYADSQRKLQDQVSALPQVKQMVAAEAQVDQGLQKQFDEQEKLKTAWIDEVRKANGWDASYIWNENTGEWSHTVAPAPKPPEPAKKP
jgi:hypothetical protein